MEDIQYPIWMNFLFMCKRALIGKVSATVLMKNTESEGDKKMRRHVPLRITRKQIDVIFSKSKAGELNVEKWMMKTLYQVTEIGSLPYTTYVEIKHILDDIFSGNISNAQRLIDEMTEEEYKKLCKYHELDRNMVR